MASAARVIAASAACPARRIRRLDATLYGIAFPLVASRRRPETAAIRIGRTSAKDAKVISYASTCPVGQFLVRTVPGMAIISGLAFTIIHAGLFGFVIQHAIRQTIVRIVRVLLVAVRAGVIARDRARAVEATVIA